MNNDLIVDFMQAYKNLDELCRQIFSVDRGVSAYIEEMELNTQGRWFVDYWNDDYKQLKHLRWVRNKLVHESDSFEDNIFSSKDIEWLRWFRSQILERTDPLARFYEYKEHKTTVSAAVNKQNFTVNPIIYRPDDNSDHMPKNLIFYVLVVLVGIIGIGLGVLYLHYIF